MSSNNKDMLIGKLSMLMIGWAEADEIGKGMVTLKAKQQNNVFSKKNNKKVKVWGGAQLTPLKSFVPKGKIVI